MEEKILDLDYTVKEQIIIEDLADVINKHCLENGSDTPDFILAEYLYQCLKNYNVMKAKRDNWFSRESE